MTDAMAGGLWVEIRALKDRVAALETQKSVPADVSAGKPVAPSGSDEEGALILVWALERIADPDDEGYVMGIAQTALDAYHETKQNIGAAPALDGWISWFGGECPCPGAVVYVTTRQDMPISFYPASRLTWHHGNHPGDIIAYRIVTPAPVAVTTTDEAPVEKSAGAVGEWPKRAAVSIAKMLVEWEGLDRNPEQMAKLDFLIERRLRRFIPLDPPPIPHDWREKMKAELFRHQAVQVGTAAQLVAHLQSKIAEWEKEG